MEIFLDKETCSILQPSALLAYIGLRSIFIKERKVQAVSIIQLSAELFGEKIFINEFRKGIKDLASLNKIKIIKEIDNNTYILSINQLYLNTNTKNEYFIKIKNEELQILGTLNNRTDYILGCIKAYICIIGTFNFGLPKQYNGKVGDRSLNYLSELSNISLSSIKKYFSELQNLKLLIVKQRFPIIINNVIMEKQTNLYSRYEDKEILEVYWDKF